MNKKTLIISVVFVGLALLLISFLNVSPIVAVLLLLCPLMHFFMGHGDKEKSESGESVHKH